MTAAPATAYPQDVGVALQFERPTFAVGEPIIALVTLTNQESTPVTLPATLEPQYQHLRFFISAPGRDGEKEFRPWATFENADVQTLAPGARLLVPSRMFFGADGWTFKENGHYAVRVTHRGSSSEPVRLEVHPATGNVERLQSAALIGSSQAGLFMLFEGGDHLTEGIKVLEQLASSATALSGYANHALGESLSKRFVNLRTGELRPPNLAAAEVRLRRASDLLRQDTFLLRYENESRLEEVVRSRGNPASAAKIQQ